MTVVYMDTNDIYKLFLNFNVPGVREEAGRLAKGVNMGDAGVMGELLQAAHDPSAGQRAMQAGEAVQQPSLAFEQQNLVSMMTSALSEMKEVIKTNNTVISTVVNNNNNFMIALVNKMEDQTDAKISAYKADAEAKMAAFKADAEAKRAQDKADAEAKRAQDKAEIMRALQKDAAGAARVGPVPPYLNRIAEPAPGAPRLGPMPRYRDHIAVPAPGAPSIGPVPPYRDHIAEPAPGAASVVPIKLKQKRKRHTAMAREKALEWIQKHSGHPYPTREEYEILCQETGVETKKRMKGLITTIRQSIWKKKKPEPTPQKTINECWARKKGPAPQIPTGPEGAVERHSKTTAEWRCNKVLAESNGAASSDGPSLPVWPKDAWELRVGVNDTWNAFQRANKGRKVSSMEWYQARMKLWEQCLDRRVCVQNLHTRKEYNGCCGRVVGLTRERFSVELDLKGSDQQRWLALNPENVKLL